MTAEAGTGGTTVSRRPRPARRWADLRTAVAGIDPGLSRLRLASIAVLSMMLAAGVTEVVRLNLAPREPVTILLFSGVVAMISNLAVNETGLARQRVTTALFLLPALASTTVGTLLSPYRIVADVVFVAVMVAAVYVRRYGPRGFALGQGAFITFFFTQFLRAQPSQLPWVLVAVTIGLASTVLLRGFLFAERPERTLRRLVAAFRARSHALIRVVDDVLAELATGVATPERDLERLRRTRARLNEVALLVEDQLEQTTAGRVWPGLDNDVLALRIFDAELALERLAVSARRLVAEGPEAGDVAVAALRTGLSHLGLALRPGTPPATILEAVGDARGAVAGLVADRRPGRERLQRAAFAVRRVADAVDHAQRDAPARRPGAAHDGHPWSLLHPHHHDTAHDGDRLRHDDARPVPAAPPGGSSTTPVAPSDPDRPDQDGPDPDRPDQDRPDGAAPAGTGPASPTGGLLLSTRQAVQVGVGTGLAIAVGELISPMRWYWAVIAAFVVFANTQSRGDLLTRGWGRIVGTIGGVAAGMALAVLVQGHQVLSLVTLFGCAFLALYLVRISPGMLAFWITAVLALVYGLIGQFSVQVLVLRIEETAVGVAASVLAAFLVLPRGTRSAFAAAVDDVVDVMDEVLDGARDRFVGRTPARRPVERARDMDDALATLRLRTRPLTPPALAGTRRRGRSSYQRGLRVLVGCDHYARSLARMSDSVTDGSWAPTLDPAVARVRANLDGLRDVLARGRRRSDGETVLVASAEEQVDAAEAHAARVDEPHRRADMLTAVRLLRRIDQAVVALAVDLGAADDRREADQEPSSAESDALANTRSGS